MALHQTFLFHKGALYPHYHLCQYLPRAAGRDELSRSLLNFKTSVPEDIRAWVDRALALLPSDLLSPGICVVRALHHQETIAGVGAHSPLDQLGAALATYFNGLYLPQLLRKSRPARKINQLPTAEREEELKDIYYICMDSRGHSGGDQPGSGQLGSDPFGSEPSGAFLVIDDILTTGATARSIIDALVGALPDCRITLFTLAKASPIGN
ncbi:MAG: hypothetical protein Q8927_05895 [Bacteroidota bacterium]|nr:hypothetical protein [Bacteroidota bacterium]MDP4215714.1 hypothetical protein [Bacteroidota bacterium]MDP4252438.1 hypothetical protein [Bacteroidota bacterium]MDP4259335.1 hypothetical protein [Bacteroidota bacterium]